MAPNIEDSKHQASLFCTLRLHWTNLTYLRACIMTKGGYFEHNLP